MAFVVTIECRVPTATATPVMRQYLDAKRQHRDAIVFFRMGDFYEMFYEDALVAARALDLTLTSRSKDVGGAGIPMCGVPFHAVDGYLAKLVGKGFRVAMCEQVEDPKKAKGLVKREVVRVVSPGTLTDAKYLEAREPAYLMAIVSTATERTRESEELFGVALLDLTTGEFTAAEYRGAEGLQALADEIAVLRPREIVLPDRIDRGEAAARDRSPAIARQHGGELELRTRSRAQNAARSAQDARARGFRPRRPDGRHPGGRRPRQLPARNPAGGSCTRPRGDAEDLDRLPHHRPGHPQAPRGHHRQRRHRRGFAAPRDRPYGHRDGRPTAPLLGAAAALCARANPRPARRGRGTGIPLDRSRASFAKR